MLAFWQRNFHDGLTLPKEFDRIRKRPSKDRPEPGVCHVPTPEPQHLRRRAAPTNELDEILVLREDYDSRLARLVEYVRVFRLS
jgi:hypothetical protein